MTTCELIRDRWPLRAMASRFGIELPRDGVKFRSPFRPDNNPSCEIYRETIRDRSAGESYDSIRVFAEAKGITNAEAIKQLAAELPGRQQQPKKEKNGLVIPNTHWTDNELYTLADVRDLDLAGVEIARSLGTLGFCKVAGFDCWILFDGSRKVAEARRMDGKPFPAVGNIGERKSHTLGGSSKSWPVGIMPPAFTVGATTPIVLGEGAPDYLAACCLLFHAKREFLPVAMLGAGQQIHQEALPLFAGRDVLILAHPDDAGTTAAKKWKGQLRAAGATPRAMKLEGGDLNDLVKLHGSQVVTQFFDL